MGVRWRQFEVLLWKNYLLQKREDLATLFELGLPLVFVLICIPRHRVETGTDSFNRFNFTYRPYEVEHLCPPDQNCTREAPQRTWKIYYTPVIPVTDRLMAATKTLLNRGKHVFEVRGFADEASMVETIESHSGRDSSSSYIVAGVVFPDMPLDGITLPSHIRYKIRLLFARDTRTLFPYSNSGQGPRDPLAWEGVYSKTGFLALQRNIDQAVMQLLGLNTTSVRVQLQRYPHPLSQVFAGQLRAAFPLVLLLSFLCSVIDLTKDVVHEKEAQLKEVMKIMGLNNWLHWLAWFVKSLLMLCIPIVAITIVLSMYLNTSSSVFLIFLLVYITATINFCFAVSVVFDKAEWAASGVGVLYIATFVLYYFLDRQPSWLRRLIALLFSNVSMAYGTLTISMYEEAGPGLHWGDFWRLPPNDTGENFTMLFVLGAMLFDAVIYAVFTWYVEAVWPGQFGIPQPWNFPLQKSYWSGIAEMDTSFERLPEACGGMSSNVSFVDTISGNVIFNESTEAGSAVSVNKISTVCDVSSTNGGQLQAAEDTPIVDTVTSRLVVERDGHSNVFANNMSVEQTPVATNVDTVASTPDVSNAKASPTLVNELSTPKHTFDSNISITVEPPSASKAPSDVNSPSDLGPYFEADPDLSYARIQTKNLRKTFGKVHKHVAVEDMNFSMYDDQITVLLGHNGAGKTTALRMLTGFYPPTSGTAIVNGYDVRTDIDRVRRSLGICPQNTVLFDTLSVEEHVQFFARLSGKPVEISSHQIRKLLKAVGLQSSSELPVQALSDGKKRKLAMLMAFVGDAQVMILDEPTAALDGDTRRQMWTILKRMRTGRTVLLSTHYMDEAEFLADRIAIMVDGRIHCCGSPAFLKKAFGAGYHLELETTAMADVQRVTELVLAYVPSATPNTDDDSRLRFNLPETSTTSFKDLLAAIEDDKEKLGVLNYHMVAMTMEDVFIRVGQMVESKDLFVNSMASTKGQNSPSIASGFVNTEAKLTRSANPSMVGGDFEADGDGSVSIEPRRLTYDEVVGVSRGDRNTGCTLLVQQFGATLLKRVLYCRRKWPLFAIQLALPLGFIVLVSLATLIVPFAGRRTNSAALPLILDEYAESCKVVYGATTQDSSTTRSLARVFASFFDGGPHELMLVADDDSVKRVLLRKAAEGYSLYRTRYLVAAEFRIETVNSTYNNTSNLTNLTNLTNASSPTGGDTFVVARALYNHEAYHTAAVALNVIDNVLLRHLVGSDNYTIETMNHPIDGADDMLTKVPVMKETFTGLLVSVVLLFGMSFYTSSFVLFLIQERKVGCLRCQIISGLRFGVYWLATFLWDLVVLYAFFGSLLILLVVLKVQCLIGDGQLWLLFLAFSWAVLPFLYVASLLFTRPSTGVARLSMLNVFVGFAAQGFWTMQSKEIEVTQASLFNSKVVVCTVLHPIFALLSGLNIFCHNWSLSFTTGISDDSPCSLDVNKDMCNLFKHQTNYVSLGDAGIGWIVLLLTVQGVIFLLILRWRGSRLLPLPWGKWLGCLLPQEPVLAQRRMTSRVRMFADDIDVEMERWRIGSKIHSPQEEVVVVHDLTRYYGHQMAINGITFGVPAGQCFGLLGVNGAGKTTTLRLIAGDLLASHGTVFVNGHDVRIDVQSAYERLAYCPQADPLLDFLTGRETLSFFARLSGIPERRIPSSVNQLILSLQLTKVADMPVMTYSMGEKRRLSAGLAFVTEPAVILIDEPSVGLDPAARRRLGKLMANFNKCGGTTVLASNCMNECEQLCQRLGMLVSGRLRCLGSPSHLRDKFGQGYTVTIKLKRTDYNPDSDQLKTYLDCHLLAATITGESDEELQYHVTNKAITWPALYAIMEEAREAHDNIVDYVISQATLQHVFLGLARLQETQDDSHMSMAASSVLGGM